MASCGCCWNSTAKRFLKAAPDIGYLHTGIEKEFEAKTYQQGVTLTDRIDYLAPLSNNLVIRWPPKSCWAWKFRRWRNGRASCWRNSRG